MNLISMIVTTNFESLNFGFFFTFSVISSSLALEFLTSIDLDVPPSPPDHQLTATSNSPALVDERLHLPQEQSRSNSPKSRRSTHLSSSRPSNSSPLKSRTGRSASVSHSSSQNVAFSVRSSSRKNSAARLDSPLQQERRRLLQEAALLFLTGISLTDEPDANERLALSTLSLCSSRRQNSPCSTTTTSTTKSVTAPRQTAAASASSSSSTTMILAPKPNTTPKIALLTIDDVPAAEGVSSSAVLAATAAAAATAEEEPRRRPSTRSSPATAPPSTATTPSMLSQPDDTPGTASFTDFDDERSFTEDTLGNVDDEGDFGKTSNFNGATRTLIRQMADQWDGDASSAALYAAQAHAAAGAAAKAAAFAQETESNPPMLQPLNSFPSTYYLAYKSSGVNRVHLFASGPGAGAPVSTFSLIPFSSSSSTRRGNRSAAANETPLVSNQSAEYAERAYELLEQQRLAALKHLRTAAAASSSSPSESSSSSSIHQQKQLEIQERRELSSRFETSSAASVSRARRQLGLQIKLAAGAHAAVAAQAAEIASLAALSAATGIDPLSIRASGASGSANKSKSTWTNEENASSNLGSSEPIFDDLLRSDPPISTSSISLTSVLASTAAKVVSSAATIAAEASAATDIGTSTSAPHSPASSPPPDGSPSTPEDEIQASVHPFDLLAANHQQEQRRSGLEDCLAPAWITSLFRSAKPLPLSPLASLPPVYNVNILDDPSLRAGTHRSVMRLPGGFHSSTLLPFVKPKALKGEVNRAFAQRHPYLPPSVTLTRLRKYKRQMLNAVLSANLELTTAALAFSLLDKLILKLWMPAIRDKEAFHISAAVCLLLAGKFSDPEITGKTDMRPLLKAIEKKMDISAKEMFAIEWDIFTALHFSLFLPLREIVPQFVRIHNDLEVIDDDYYATSFLN